MKLISVAFFLSAVPSMVKLGLGGPYLTLRLVDQDFTTYQLGLFSLFLIILSGTFQAVFAILTIVGLVRLSAEAR